MSSECELCGGIEGHAETCPKWMPDDRDPEDIKLEAPVQVEFPLGVCDMCRAIDGRAVTNKLGSWDICDACLDVLVGHMLVSRRLATNIAGCVISEIGMRLAKRIGEHAEATRKGGA